MIRTVPFEWMFSFFTDYYSQKIWASYHIYNSWHTPLFDRCFGFRSTDLNLFFNPPDLFVVVYPLFRTGLTDRTLFRTGLTDRTLFRRGLVDLKFSCLPSIFTDGFIWFFNDGLRGCCFCDGLYIFTDAFSASFSELLICFDLGLRDGSVDSSDA